MKDKYLVTIFAAIILAPAIISATGAQTSQYFFTIHQTMRPPYAPEYGELLAEELAKIGIKLEVETVDSPTFIDKIHKTFYDAGSWEDGGVDLWVPAWGWARYDMVLTKTYFYSDFKAEMSTTTEFPDWSGSILRWFNPRVDALYDLAFREFDQAKKQEYMWEVAEIVANEVPAIPVLYPKAIVAGNPDITGYLPRFGGGETRVLKKIGITGKTTADDVTFTYATSSEWRSLYGIFSDTVFDRFVTDQMTDRLIDFNEDLKPTVPNLAQSWESSENGTKTTFHLRDDVYWHDGVKFTSADVKFTFDTILDSATDYGWWHIIQPAGISSVEAPDDYTVIINQENPYAATMIAIAYVDIIAKHQWEGIDHDAMRAHSFNLEGPMVGTGPFKLVGVVPGDHVELEANSEYFEGEPIIDRLFIRVIPETSTAIAALETGEVDLISSRYALAQDIESLRANVNIQTFEYESGYTQSIAINSISPPLNNKWVRRAIAYMIPKEHIVNDIRNGLGSVADQIAPPFSYGHNPNVAQYEYSLEKAKESMKKAGYDLALLQPLETPLTNYVIIAAIGVVAGTAIGSGLVMWRKRSK